MDMRVEYGGGIGKQGVELVKYDVELVKQGDMRQNMDEMA